MARSAGVVRNGDSTNQIGLLYTVGPFHGKAKAATGGLKDIVTAQIDSWDASWDHILIDHTGAGVAEGKLNKEIVLD